MSIPSATRPAAAARRPAAAAVFDVQRVREDFPILHAEGPRQAAGLPRQRRHHAEAAGRPRRAAPLLRARQRQRPPRPSTCSASGPPQEYEEARVKVQRLPQRRRRRARSSSSAAPPRRSTSSPRPTAGSNVRAGDEVIITAMEHHSNIVPWQMLCEEKGAMLARRARSTTPASCCWTSTRSCSTPRTRLVAVVHVSNALGTINPVKRIIELAHAPRRAGAGRRRPGGAAPAGRRAGAGLRLLRLLRPQAVRPDRHRRAVRQGDAAGGDAAVPGRRRHDPLGDVREDDLQRAAVQVRGRHAGHRRRHRPRAPPSTTSQRSAWRPSPPTRTCCCTTPPSRLQQIPGVRIIGTAAHKAAVLSFVVDDPPLSALDVGTQLDLEGIAVRTGHHCCQPLMDRFGVPGTARASFAMYNTTEEVDALRGGAARRSSPRRSARAQPAAAPPAGAGLPAGRRRPARRRRPTSWPRSSSSSTTGPSATSTSSSWARSCRRCRRR